MLKWRDIMNAYIIDAVRIPVGRRKGVYSETRSEDLLVHVLKGLIEKNNISPKLVEDVIVGCVTQNNEQGNNIARIATLMAGFPETTPAETINRKCSSSQQAIHHISQAIIAGDIDVGIAAGIENMTRHPLGTDRVPEPEILKELYEIIPQGESAERIAEIWGFNREQLDELSVRSHALANKATKEGAFKREILPITVTKDNTEIVVTEDEGIRPGTTVESLSKLKTVFREENGQITAGNSSQISDGASAVLIMSEKKIAELGIKPRARIIAREVVGSDPTLMLTGPIAVTKKILEKTNLTVDDIDIFECNEAFASVVLAWQKELNVPFEKINVRGGAIALGHPTGASGARLMTTLLHSLEDLDKKYGLQVMCAGGGMATATIIERV